ncbi:MAG: OmpA family protein [Paludibacteraceae bacterium]|nr:OmpA family protein [Paludibacteraceae bacterium]
MKHLRLFLVLFVALMMIVPSQDAMAQRRRKKKKKEPEKEQKDLGLTHCLGLYGGIGYSNFLHSIENSKTPGGAGGMVGIQYMLKKHKPGTMNPNKMFTFAVGIEPQFLNSTTRLNDFTYEGTLTHVDGAHPNNPIPCRVDFYKYNEQHNRFGVLVPIMFGAQINRYYFQVGAKAGLGLLGGYSTRGKGDLIVMDPQLIDEIEQLNAHSVETHKVVGKGKVNFDLDVALSAEFGVVMDEWMPANALMTGKKKHKIPMSYRLGLFLDYGLFNLNSNPDKKILFANAKDDDLLYYNSGKTDPILAGSHSSDIGDFGANSVLASKRWGNDAKNALNSFILGAKFTVLFQVSPQPKPIKKKPRPRPKPKQVKIPTYPPFFYCVTLDGETDAVIPAQVVLTRLDQNVGDTAFVAKVDPSVGFVQNQMVSEKFLISVKCRGYMDYNDTVYQIDNDTVYAQLMPIKKNSVVILKNLLFDTDKTVIKNTSTQSLEDLYKLLSENPKLKIQITGHTDNVGSDAHNQKLSEGRAKAVYQEMVKRGINPHRMSWRGAGESEPIESNDTPEGRAENRRVEFMIL